MLPIRGARRSNTLDLVTVPTSRIQAVEHIVLEAPAGIDEALRWFYSDVARLKEVPTDGAVDPKLCFISAQIELRTGVVEHPRIDPMLRRLTVLVPSLAEAAEQLDERAVPYQRCAGLLFTDRRIAVHDPAGHLMELKQGWPEAPL